LSTLYLFDSTEDRLPDGIAPTVSEESHSLKFHAW